jgi:Glucodextranase, domain B
VSTRRIRPIAVLAALTFVALLVFAAGASAAITSTHITTPTDGTYYFEDASVPGPEVTVSGTVEGGGEELEIRCYAGDGTSTEVGEVEEEEIKKNKFSVKVSSEEIGEAPCVLRAVPIKEKAASLPPGAVTAFEGPRVTYSEYSPIKDPLDSAVTGYFIEARTLSSVFEIDAAGTCGLGPTALVSSPSLAESAELFRCAGALYGQSAGASRPAIQIDGHNAYDVYGADAIWNAVKPSNTPPNVTVEKTFDKTGLKTLHEQEPLVECEGKVTAFPETKESCEKFVSSGVTLERTWTPSNGGRLISMSDVWQSTDSAAHAISALYVNELGSDMAVPGTYQLPGGVQAFAPTTTGATAALTATEGAILYREDGTAEEVLGGAHPVGAVILGATPAGPLQVTAGSAETKGSDSFQLPYSFEVPASGNHTLTMAFAQGYTLHEVCVLAEEANSGCQPSAAISSPQAGSTISSPSVTVSGTAADIVGLSSVTVNGHPVTVTSGAWTTSVPLTPGANTITAVAGNQAGLTRSVTSSVTYTPVLGPQGTGTGTGTGQPRGESNNGPPKATASKVGATKLVKGNLTIVISCAGPAGTSCTVKASVSTVEKLRGGHPSALAAAAAHGRTVTVGTVSASIPAGSSRTLAIKLNATGRALLAHFHKLPLRLAVVQQGPSGASASVAGQILTIISKHR